MTNSDVKKIIDFIQDYFQKNSWAKGVVIGMSGGKDSLVVAKLCVEALGKDRVLGVIMPNGHMTDLSDAIDSCNRCNKILQLTLHSMQNLSPSDLKFNIISEITGQLCPKQR
mgnify:CR=1 FL=1